MSHISSTGDTFDGMGYFEILLIGKTGQGKSTTGNKLINSEGSEPVHVKQWTSNLRGLLLELNKPSEAANAREI